MRLSAAQGVLGRTSALLRQALQRLEFDEAATQSDLRSSLRRGDAAALAFRRNQVQQWRETGHGLQELQRMADQPGANIQDIRTAAMILERRGLLRRPSNWTVALNTLARIGDARGAMWLVERMEQPDTIAYNVVLRACAAAVATSEANELLRDRMPGRGVKPDAVSYAMAVGAQDAWNATARKWMRLGCEIGDDRGKLLACRQAMRLCARTGDWVEAVRILTEELPKYGLNAESQDFRDAIHACAVAGPLDAARRVLEMARLNGVDSDATWAWYVSACGRANNKTEAVAAYRQLGDLRRPEATALVANSVMRVFATKRDGDGAQTFLDEDILSRDHPTTIETYIWAMRARRDDWRLCLDLLASARKAGHTITARACVPALEAVAHAGETRVAADFVDEMSRRGLKLTDAGLAAMMRCKTNAGDPQDALFTFSQDARWNHPGAVCAALEACTAIPDADAAADIFDKYCAFRTSHLDARIVQAYAACLAALGKWIEAVDLVSRKFDAISRRGAYDAALAACCSPEFLVTSPSVNSGEGEVQPIAREAVQMLAPRLQAAADCWDLATRRSIYADPKFGKRCKVLNVDVHGASVPVAIAATLACLRRAYVTQPEMPPTLSVITGSSSRRARAPILQPALVQFLSKTFNMASCQSAANSGALIIAASSIQGWGSRYPNLATASAPLYDLNTSLVGTRPSFTSNTSPTQDSEKAGGAILSTESGL